MKSRLEHIADWAGEAKQARYSVASLARRCQVTGRQFRRFVLGKFGVTPRKWLTLMRLQLSREQLSKGALVKEAAQNAGFDHPESFSRLFKRHYKANPRDLRGKTD